MFDNQLVAKFFYCKPHLFEYNLKAGEIWKIGETTNIQKRISQYGGYKRLAIEGKKLIQVDNNNLNQMQSKAMEKYLLASYVILYGNLPPSNTVEYR